ncbi:hypothetical protein C8Q76DRAFT_752496 [Earliella scabrosa]|nr:hypothetical protein C8Q76DRAFT_752496 [Earliella scabrosa]
MLRPSSGPIISSHLHLPPLTMEPQSSASKLAVEITDLIIDHLHDNVGALKSCALVHSSWTPATRLHLFASLSISQRRCALSDFIAFITSADGVVTHIKRLSLSGYVGMGLNDLSSILRRLPSLRILTLTHVYISNPLSYDGPHPPAIPELSTLQITDVVYDNGENLLRLLGLFRHVGTVRLGVSDRHNTSPRRAGGGGGPMRPPIVLAVPFPSHLRVDNLAISSLSRNNVMWLFHPSSFPQWGSLESLSIERGCCTWEEVEVLGDLLAAIGSKLRRLDVRPSDRLLSPPQGHLGLGPGLGPAAHHFLNGTPPPMDIGSTVEAWRALNLSHCTSLDVFSTGLGHIDAFSLKDHTRGGLFKTCVDLLAHLPSAVREVRFSVPVPPLESHPNARGDQIMSFAYYAWAALQKALCDPRFKGTTLVVELSTFSTADDDPELKELITRTLRRSPARGMSTVTMVQVARWHHL